MTLEASTRAEHRLWLAGLQELCPMINNNQSQGNFYISFIIICFSFIC